LVWLGPVARLTAPDVEQAEHDALVGDAIEVVELRLDLQIGPRRIEPVGAHLEGWIVRLPGVGANDIRMLMVGPAARQSAGTNAGHPDASERIVKAGGAVAAGAAHQGRFAPVNAVG